MSAPYKGFWIIVGMTVGAVVIANSTAKPRRSSTTTTSSDYSSTHRVPGTPSTTFSKPVASERLPSSLPQPTEEVAGLSPVVNPPTLKTEVASTSAVTAETRSIDGDFQLAFDRAMESVVAIPNPPADQTATAANVALPPPLQPREIAPAPAIFVQPATSLSVDEDGELNGNARALTTTDLNLRAGPGPEYSKVETMAKGSEVIILERPGKWWRVKSKMTNAEGWINGTFVTAAKG
ncbi:SH3 domain-containing protein [Agrobacterium sp. BA1120]|uniref:SH3 domain-containing protein n=1 Tax=Agrobacterium sp. BA1120 TaxID=3228927 RepID=UPI00336A8404